jgi:hypothetical protein
MYIVPINNRVCELSNVAVAVYKLCLNIIFSVATLHNKIVKSALIKQQKSFEKLSTHEKMIEVFYLKYLKDKKNDETAFFVLPLPRNYQNFEDILLWKVPAPSRTVGGVKVKIFFQSQTLKGLCPSMHPPHRHLIQIGLPAAL